MATEADQALLRESKPIKGRSTVTKSQWNICRINCLIPCLFVATIILPLLIMMGRSSEDEKEYLKYSVVTGYFQQDDPATNPNGFDYTAANFGLIERGYDVDADFDPDHKKTQWQRFEAQVAKFNQDSDSKVEYKVLYMGRHGEGFHNVAEAFYGTKAWDCYWSLQDGDGTSTWLDALLTSTGEAQASIANNFWTSMISTQKIPTPQSYYTSPLRRCMATASITFSGLDLPADRPFIPTIKELFRETIGAHTCDKRSSKSVIQKLYPKWVIEEGFAEDDPLWSATLRETNEAQDQRAKIVLDDVFTNDKNTYISISSHSGQIASALRVLGHREFGLGTGQVIPVLVRAERVRGSPPPTKAAPWEPVETCSEPPKL